MDAPKQNQELMELKHDARPGFKTLLLVLVALAMAYAALVFSGGLK